MRRLENYIRKYGPEFGPILYHALQSQAAHAGVSARLRRKLEVMSGKRPATPRRRQREEVLPLFPAEPRASETVRMETTEPVAIGA